jgi:hypothetical protein
MSNFRTFDRETGFLLPPSLNEWLPERHLARFVVEVIDTLDLSAMEKSYRGPPACRVRPQVPRAWYSHSEREDLAHQRARDHNRSEHELY